MKNENIIAIIKLLNYQFQFSHIYIHTYIYNRILINLIKS